MRIGTSQVPINPLGIFYSRHPLITELGIAVMLGSIERNVKQSKMNMLRFEWIKRNNDGQISWPLIVLIRLIGGADVHLIRRARIISANILSGYASGRKVFSPTNRQCHSMAKSGDKQLPLFSGSMVSIIKIDL